MSNWFYFIAGISSVWLGAVLSDMFGIFLGSLFLISFIWEGDDE